MSIDRASATGVLGGPPRQPQGDTNKRDLLVFGQDAQRCARTGRFFETGAGSLPRDEQAAMFLWQQAIANDMPREGECCVQTGRPYVCCSGALTKTQQTAAFLAELPPAAIAERQAAANALAAVEPEGNA